MSYDFDKIDNYSVTFNHKLKITKDKELEFLNSISKYLQ